MPSARHQGRTHKLRIGGSPLPWKCEITNGFSSSASSIDASCKDDAGAGFKFAGTRETTIDIEWYVDYTTDAGAYTHKEASADYQNATVVAFELGTGTTGDEKITGNAVFTSFSIDASDEEGVKGTATLELQGDYTLADYV